MAITLKALLRRAGQTAKPLGNVLAGRAMRLFLWLLRRGDRIRLSNLFGRVMRAIGPWLPEHRIGQNNLTAAFPDKSPEEIETILRGVWDNLGRVVAEFAQLDRVASGQRMARDFVDYDAGTIQRFLRLQEDGKPALVFAAHCANWELPAIIAAADGLDTTVLYRRPNFGAVADAVIAVRAGMMGTMIATSLDAPIKLARAIEAGSHVAMLVDQHYGKGVEVTMFGRRCRANPLVAMLARQYECPIHGTRMIRLPNGRFRADLTEAVEPVRDAEGRIDVPGTMQAITTVIEGWVREYPEQWLWLHRRWR
jgi:Kdo2-lipid IVA lauroyltransferase/acyltransferase